MYKSSASSNALMSFLRRASNAFSVSIIVLNRSRYSFVLKIAAAEVGTKESPAGSNRVKYNTVFYGREVSGAAYPWCMAFVYWVFKQAGFSLLKTASCTVLANAYKKAGQWVDCGLKPGDIVTFDFSGQKKITQHVGIYVPHLAAIAA